MKINEVIVEDATPVVSPQIMKALDNGKVSNANAAKAAPKTGAELSKQFWSQPAPAQQPAPNYSQQTAQPNYKVTQNPPAAVPQVKSPVQAAPAKPVAQQPVSTQTPAGQATNKQWATSKGFNNLTDFVNDIHTRQASKDPAIAQQAAKDEQLFKNNELKDRAALKQPQQPQQPQAAQPAQAQQPAAKPVTPAQPAQVRQQPQPQSNPVQQPAPQAAKPVAKQPAPVQQPAAKPLSNGVLSTMATGANELSTVAGNAAQGLGSKLASGLDSITQAVKYAPYPSASTSFAVNVPTKQTATQPAKPAPARSFYNPVYASNTVTVPADGSNPERTYTRSGNTYVDQRGKPVSPEMAHSLSIMAQNKQ